MSESVVEKVHTTAVRLESQVGILLRIGTHPRFNATLKERFSDFHVNEIDVEGNIVHLTSVLAPIEEKASTESPEDTEVNKCLTEEVRTKISDLQQQLLERNRNFRNSKIEIDVTDLEKDQRTKIHNWISSFDQLASTTLEKDGKKFIVVSSQSNKTYRRPANRAKYTHCVLYKEGVETSSVIGYIAKKLNVKPNLIAYAGTKDRQAKTTQRISIPNIDANKLIEISNYSRNSKLGNFEYLSKPIFLGCLSGNHFKILLKNVDADTDSIIDESINSLKNKGFINYYGMQRFGSYEVSTHEIGKAVLQSDYIKVFDLILREKDNDPDFLKKAKEAWFKHRDPHEAKTYFPRSYRSIESNLMFGLSKYYHKKLYLAVFQSIPTNTRQLYVHAVQSYLWNRMASYRIEKYGLRPIVGDLVYANPTKILSSETETEVTEHAGAENDQASTDTPQNEEISQKLNVILVTEGNKSIYSIYDILIPLPGPDIKFPKNGVKDFYESILREEGIPVDCFSNSSSKGDRLNGAYRKMMIRPKNVSYEIIPYSEGDNLDTVIKSDLDILDIKLHTFVNKPMETDDTVKTGIDSVKPIDNDKVESSAPNGASETVLTPLKEVALPSKDPETISQPEAQIKNKKCVKVEFSLPSSSYATMALREMLVETENVHHKTRKDLKRPVSESGTDALEVEDQLKKPKMDEENGSAEDKNGSQLKE